MRIDSNTELQELFDIAKETVNELETGEEFIVKDLFRGFEWNRIQKGYRTKLGSVFLMFSQYEGKSIVKALDKTPQNQQKYIKL